MRSLHILFAPLCFRAVGALRVISPHGGDRFTTGINIDIRWEKGPADTEESVRIELQKGEPGSLMTVHNIKGETPNNGTYTWRSREDFFLDAIVGAELPRNPPSACDYVVAIRGTTTSAYSEYFTIINLNDNGLPPNTQCPSSSGIPSEGPGTVRGGSGNQTSGTGPDSTAVPENQTGSLDTPNGSSTSSGGVGAAALGGAIGGVAAALLCIFAVVVFLGRPRGWFVSEDFIRQKVAAAIAEMPLPPLPSTETKPNYNYESPESSPGPIPRKILGPGQRREINSQNIYQMPAHPAEK